LVLRRLARGWRLPLALGLAACVAAVAWSLYRDPRYVATAMVAVTKPQVAAAFDPRLAAEQLDASFPYQVETLRAYAELARTEDLARTVADSLGPESGSPDTLLERIHVEALADGSLLVIRARAPGPEPAAALANAWAGALIDRTSQVYGGRLAVDQVVAQRDEAEQAVAQAEARLADFHRASLLPAREVELERLRTSYDDALALADRLRTVVDDTEVLRQQGAAAAPDTADRLAALALQLRTLSPESTLPLTVDLAVAGLDTRVSPSDLDLLRQSAVDAKDRVARYMEPLPGRLAEATADVQTLTAERTRLERERDLAVDRYTALAHKADELSLTRAAAGTELQVAAVAAAPSGSDWLTPAKQGGYAAVLGLVLGAALLFVPAAGARRWSSPPVDR
jgi:capsular polysaccharide biosynthesis protein